MKLAEAAVFHGVTHVEIGFRARKILDGDGNGVLSPRRYGKNRGNGRSKDSHFLSPFFTTPTSSSTSSSKSRFLAAMKRR